MKTLVTGGAGYLGSITAHHLLRTGRDVRVVDVLLHGQQEVADTLRSDGIDVVVGDVRDADVVDAVLDDVEAVVHLAAVVGDLACRIDPERSDSTNLGATRLLAEQAALRGVPRFVFASTCSNYGVVDEDAAPVDEDHELRPASRYARQKVEAERYLARSHATSDMTVTCLRLSTLFGASPRMRFDLLVNEFVRDLWADRTVEVYGTGTWRPYVHVQDAARAIELALTRTGPTSTYNVGADESNYRKLELARLVATQIGRGRIETVASGDDPRSYRVAFERIRRDLDFAAAWSIPRGIDELCSLVAAGSLEDPWHPRHVNA